MKKRFVRSNVRIQDLEDLTWIPQAGTIGSAIMIEDMLNELDQKSKKGIKPDLVLEDEEGEKKEIKFKINPVTLEESFGDLGGGSIKHLLLCHTDRDLIIETCMSVLGDAYQQLDQLSLTHVISNMSDKKLGELTDHASKWCYSSQKGDLRISLNGIIEAIKFIEKS